MAIFKLVYTFTLSQNGWSEVYYINQTDLQTAANVGASMASFMMAFRHQDAVLNKVRASDVLNERATVVVNINMDGNPFDKTAGPDVTGTAAVFTLNSTAVPANRQVWLRGLPDSYVIRDAAGATDDPPGALRMALNVWLGKMVQNSFQVRSLTKVAIPAVPPNNYGRILSITGTPGAGITTITTDGNYNPSGPGRAIISLANPKTSPGLNGHWTVTAVGGDNYTIPYNMPSAGPIPQPKTRMRPEIYQYGIVNQTTSGFNFYRGRKTGKSFLGGRGRRTAVRLRSL